MSSCLNYCNSLLYVFTDTDLIKLQCVQNRLTCVVTKVTSFHSQCSTASFPSLVASKMCKIIVLTYKTIHEKQTVYLHPMLAASLPSHSLRSNKGISLSVPRVQTMKVAGAFQSCASSLWNNLPLSVHWATSVATSKKHLQTHLFDLALSPWTPAHPMAHSCYNQSINQPNFYSANIPSVARLSGAKVLHRFWCWTSF